MAIQISHTLSSFNEEKNNNRRFFHRKELDKHAINEVVKLENKGSRKINDQLTVK